MLSFWLRKDDLALISFSGLHALQELAVRLALASVTFVLQSRELIDYLATGQTTTLATAPDSAQSSQA